MNAKVALVTGGTGGIGTAICQYLTREGYKVAAGYNKDGNHESAKLWQTQQQAQGYDFTLVYGDVANFDSAGIMVAAVTEVLGPVDILVNNAGITQDATLRKMDEKQWLKVINANLNSVFNVTRQVINSMIDRQYGRIINISSILWDFRKSKIPLGRAGIPKDVASVVVFLSSEEAKWITGITLPVDGGLGVYSPFSKL